MTLLSIKSLLTLTVGSFLVTTTQVAAKASTRFFCGKIGGLPATMAKTPRGDVPVIRWVSDYFGKDGYTPQKRCEDVSARFQKYYADGSLKYLTTGERNGLPIICTAERENGICKNLLFTLKAGTDPSKALQNIFNVRNSAKAVLDESGEKPTNYIDIEELLGNGVNTDSSTEQNQETKSLEKEKTR